MKIKPCPFCGEQPKLWERKGNKGNYTLGCNDINCFLWIPEDVRLRELHNYAPCYYEKKELIEAWNKRYKEYKTQPSLQCKPDTIELGESCLKVNSIFKVLSISLKQYLNKFKKKG